MITIPQKFIDAAVFWHQSTYYGIDQDVSDVEIDYLSSAEFNEWLQCEDNDTLAFFDLLLGAAEAS